MTTANLFLLIISNNLPESALSTFSPSIQNAHTLARVRAHTLLCSHEGRDKDFFVQKDVTSSLENVNFLFLR